MKAVIFAGGLGTRLSEETDTKPKPMVEIGGMPIIWHILKMYSHHGINDFIICCGYKGYIIKEYFANYFLHSSDITVDLKQNKIEFLKNCAEPWRVTLVDTGDLSMTGGRLLRIREHLADDETFCLTYGDGVGDINIRKCINFHKSHGKLATMTSTFPPGRFGSITINKNLVTEFTEKPKGDAGLINAGFFVLQNNIFDYLVDDTTIWEQEPLKRLASDQELMTFVHDGFWQPMDTLRDKILLNNLWSEGNAPWSVW